MNRLVPALGAARLFGGAAALFGVDAAFLGGFGGTGLLADLGFDQCGADQGFETLERDAAIGFLGALAHGLEEDGAVVDDLLAGEPAQAISCSDRQADVLWQQEAQLRGARHFVDVLATGTRGTDEFPFQFLVRDDDARRDDQRHGQAAVQSKSSGAECMTISRCATGMVMLCCLNSRHMARFTSERTLFTPS